MKHFLLALFSVFAFTSFAQTWSELGKDSTALNANYPIASLCCDSNGNIYAAGSFQNSSGNAYVAKWDGTGWIELGVNNTFFNNQIRTVCADSKGNIYAAGRFTNSLSKYFVAKWNGTTWAELGSDSNALNANDDINSICIDSMRNVFAAGKFTNASGYNYVAKWDGISWKEIGSGNNTLNSSTIYSICTDNVGSVYAAVNIGQNYVYKWDGAKWSELGNGSNKLSANSQIATISADSKGNIFAAGYFRNSKNNYYVAKWNGTLWVELGSGANELSANSPIKTICIDKSDNIYAGILSDYVTKWNWGANTWTALYGLNPNGTINSLCIDKDGYPYAAGNFNNTNGKYFVAKYAKVFTTTTITACQNYIFNGKALTTNGTYVDTFSNFNGDDSIVTIKLTVNKVTAYITQKKNVFTVNTSGGSTINYIQWLNCNLGYSPIIGDTNLTYTPMFSGDFAVLVTNKKSGCCDTTECINFINLGISEISGQNQMRIFPNPTVNDFTVEYSSNRIDKISIFNILGQQIFTEDWKPTQMKQSIDISAFPKGV